MRMETCKLTAQMDNVVDRKRQPQTRTPDLARWFYSVLTPGHCFNKKEVGVVYLKCKLFRRVRKIAKSDY
jgi:hypothetical protein